MKSFRGVMSYENHLLKQGYLIECRTCSAVYSVDGWFALPPIGHAPQGRTDFNGLQPNQMDDGYVRLDMRNCRCNTTLSIELCVHVDLEYDRIRWEGRERYARSTKHRVHTHNDVTAMVRVAAYDRMRTLDDWDAMMLRDGFEPEPL